MVQVLKVPGKKAKSYEQQYVRTMFFENVEKMMIDGTEYEIPNSCKVDMVKCKEKLFDISMFFDNQWENK
jgi:hypothetical protein